jgi:hypothetical protein
MSRHAQLSEWAHARPRAQHGERPRAYWTRRRGTRHVLEDQATLEQLALDFAPHPDLKRPEPPRGGAPGGAALTAMMPKVPPRNQPENGAPAPFSRRSRPTLEDCAREPWRAFD